MRCCPRSSRCGGGSCLPSSSCNGRGSLPPRPDRRIRSSPRRPPRRSRSRISSRTYSTTSRSPISPSSAIGTAVPPNLDQYWEISRQFLEIAHQGWSAYLQRAKPPRSGGAARQVARARGGAAREKRHGTGDRGGLDRLVAGGREHALRDRTPAKRRRCLARARPNPRRRIVRCDRWGKIGRWRRIRWIPRSPSIRPEAALGPHRRQARRCRAARRSRKDLIARRFFRRLFGRRRRPIVGGRARVRVPASIRLPILPSWRPPSRAKRRSRLRSLCARRSKRRAPRPPWSRRIGRWRGASRPSSPAGMSRSTIPPAFRWRKPRPADLRGSLQPSPPRGSRPFRCLPFFAIRFRCLRPKRRRSTPWSRRSCAARGRHREPKASCVPSKIGGRSSFIRKIRGRVCIKTTGTARQGLPSASAPRSRP